MCFIRKNQRAYLRCVAKSKPRRMCIYTGYLRCFFAFSECNIKTKECEIAPLCWVSLKTLGRDIFTKLIAIWGWLHDNCQQSRNTALKHYCTSGHNSRDCWMHVCVESHTNTWYFFQLMYHELNYVQLQVKDNSTRNVFFFSVADAPFSFYSIVRPKYS